MAVCSNGNADKAQVQRMVQRLLGLDSIPSPDDAADALAVALAGVSLLYVCAKAWRIQYIEQWGIIKSNDSLSFRCRGLSITEAAVLLDVNGLGFGASSVLVGIGLMLCRQQSAAYDTYAVLRGRSCCFRFL